jgi:lycopene beta-cyclase|tara:strand:- start:8358 stop:9476 length:1119 start_codon:yes stop_codon:yes gene_type:complete
MKEKFDIIVIGAGLSSLMFLVKYVKKHPQQKILLLDKDHDKKNDQTFCVWQGPDIINLTDEFDIQPKKIWGKIMLDFQNRSIKKVMSPYNYKAYDGQKTLSSLLRSCKKNITYKNNCEVVQVKKNGLFYVITKDSSVYSSQTLVDSRHYHNTYDSKEMLYQAFYGSEVEMPTNTFDETTVTLMSFKENKNDIEFTYILPYTKKIALIETTFFAKNPNINDIKLKHEEKLKQYGKYTLLRSEEGILPMGNIKTDKEGSYLKIGISAGMIRPSSGYSMIRIANWINQIEDTELNQQNLSKFRFKSPWLLNWLDKQFLKVCFYRPEMAPELFMSLFSKANIGSVVRFMADKPTINDVIAVIQALPKKIMIKYLIK